MPPTIPSAELLALARLQVRRLALVMIALNLVVPALVFVGSRLAGDPFWTYLRGEENAVTWFSTLQLLIVGVACYLSGVAEMKLTHPASATPIRSAWIWWVFTAGFLFLGIDERFELHEQLRDEVVAPRGHFTEISFLEPGDIGLYLIALVGAVFTLFLLGRLKRFPPARPLFLIALVLSVVIVVVDSLRGDIAYNLPAAWFWNYVFEEIGELWAQLLFLLSVLVVLDGRLSAAKAVA